MIAISLEAFVALEFSPRHPHCGHARSHEAGKNAAPRQPRPSLQVSSV